MGKKYDRNVARRLAGVACLLAAASAADVNGDAHVDIVCIDRMDELMLYENTGL